MHLESVEKYQSLAEVMQLELRQSSKFMKEYTPKRFGEYLNLISETIRKGQEADLIRKDLHPAMIKRAIFGAMDEIALGWVLSKQRKRKSYELAECADKLADIFLAGLVLPKEEAIPCIDKLGNK
jgi:TetR/AcrR family fatty acid metabolism transcriptional regulator